MKNNIMVIFILILCGFLFILFSSQKDELKFSPSKYTFESESFYVDSKIKVNGLDDEQKKGLGVNPEFISFDITFDVIPKDGEKVYSNIKVDAIINENITNLLLVTSSDNIKSYEDQGADIGFGMPTFAISLGKLNWINENSLKEISKSPSIIRNDVSIVITWKDGDESFVIPSEYLNIILNN